MYKYKLIDVGKPLSDEDFLYVEEKIGQKLPAELREFYKRNNGGEVEGGRYVYIKEDDGIDFGVKTFIPIRYKRFDGDSLLEDDYEFYVKTKQFIATHFIPIAMDDGGSPYCYNTKDQAIYVFYETDLKYPEGPMRLIAPGLKQFIDGLLTADEAYK